MKKLYHRLTGLEIDTDIPCTRVFGYTGKKFLDMCRGFLMVRKRKIFIDRNCIIKSKCLIKMSAWLAIGHDVYIDALSRNGVHFGKHVSIGCFTRIECTGSLSHLGEGFRCGDNCGLGTNCFYGAAGGITLGSNVIVGNYVSFHSENHNFADMKIPIRLQGTSHKGIIVGDNCWIGAKATILDGVRIGNGCVIAAGSVVTKSFPNNVVVAGVPARIIKQRELMTSK